MVFRNKLVVGTAAAVVGLSMVGKVLDSLDTLVDNTALTQGMRSEAQRYDLGGLSVNLNPGDDSTCLADYVLTTRNGDTVTITVPRVGDAELRDATFSKDFTCIGDGRYNLKQGIDAVRGVGYGVCDDVTDGNRCGTSVASGLVGFFQSMGRGLGRMYDTVLGRSIDVSQRLEKGYKAATE